MSEQSQPYNHRHARVLDFIRTYVKQKGYPPSRREIETATGLSSASTTRCLEELDAQGSIQVDHNRGRGLRLTGPSATWPQLRIPLLGSIWTGVPSYSDNDFGGAGDIVEFARSLVPAGVDRSRLFALYVKGHGLIDLLIQDGDLTILEALSRPKGFKPRGGEVVAISFPDHGQSVLTRLYSEKDGWRLESANQDISPIFLKRDIQLQVDGRLVAVIRSFK